MRTAVHLERKTGQILLFSTQIRISYNLLASEEIGFVSASHCSVVQTNDGYNSALPIVIARWAIISVSAIVFSSLVSNIKSMPIRGLHHVSIHQFISDVVVF